MKDSTYPQGFFSNLKSLFISPRYVPDVELIFFEASLDHFKINTKRERLEEPNFTTPFPQQATRCIWCYVSGKWVKGEICRGRKYTLSYNLYRPDGTLLSHQTEKKLQISYKYYDISGFVWRTYGYGWREPGHWTPGVYQAEVLIDGARAATGQFTIAPTPPPPPPPPPAEVLRLPRVQFYASEPGVLPTLPLRYSFRFPQQTTPWVHCELTVRNLLYGQRDWGYRVRVLCYTVSESIQWEHTPPYWKISSQHQEPSISWNIPTSGWAQGAYRVEILIDWESFAWGVFAIE